MVPDSLTTITVWVHADSENSLRSAVLEFMDTVRTTEQAIAAGRRGDDVPKALDSASLGEITEEEWRAYWPPEGNMAELVVQTAETEPAPDRIPEPAPAETPEPRPVEEPEPGPVDVPEPSPEDVVAIENGVEPAGQPEGQATTVESK